MATSSVKAEDTNSRRRGLNPQAEAFFPYSSTVCINPIHNPPPSSFSPYNPPIAIPPFHFVPPRSLGPPPPPAPPHPHGAYFPGTLPYTYVPPTTSHPVLPEAFPASDPGRGSNHRPRGRGLGEGRRWNGWRGRGGRAPRGRLPRSGGDSEVWQEEEDFDDKGDSGLVKESASAYQRVVKARRRCELNKRKKPVVQLSEGGDETTVMIRNIPNRYTRELLIDFLDGHCASENQKLEMVEGNDEERSAYDFVYLPLDLRKKANLGYAFVNFTDPRAAWRFFLAANGQRWELFYSNKVREVASARLQGTDELVQHFQSTMFACESEDFLPVCFSPPRDGSGNQVTQKLVGGFTPTKY